MALPPGSDEDVDVAQTQQKKKRRISKREEQRKMFQQQLDAQRQQIEDQLRQQIEDQRQQFEKHRQQFEEQLRQQFEEQRRRFEAEPKPLPEQLPFGDNRRSHLCHHVCRLARNIGDRKVLMDRGPPIQSRKSGKRTADISPRQNVNFDVR